MSLKEKNSRMRVPDFCFGILSEGTAVVKNFPMNASKSPSLVSQKDDTDIHNFFYTFEMLKLF